MTELIEKRRLHDPFGYYRDQAIVIDPALGKLLLAEVCRRGPVLEFDQWNWTLAARLQPSDTFDLLHRCWGGVPLVRSVLRNLDSSRPCLNLSPDEVAAIAQRAGLLSEISRV